MRRSCLGNADMKYPAVVRALRQYGLTLFCLLWFSAQGYAGRAEPLDIKSLLPGIDEISGWKRHGAPYVYMSDKLYSYIDGAADQFLAYGFVKLVGAEYICTADSK